mgnify:CR=1 FL=1
MTSRTPSIVFDASCDTFVQATGEDEGELNGLRGLRQMKTVDGPVPVDELQDIAGRGNGRQIDLSQTAGYSYADLQMKRKYGVLKRQRDMMQTSRDNYAYYARNGMSSVRLQRVRATMNCAPPYPLKNPAYKAGIKGGKTLLYDMPSVPFYSNI